MIPFLTRKARIICKHRTGVVQLYTFQDTVTIEGVPVLVDDDPEEKIILGCSNVGATIKPCFITLKATKGYSDFIFINDDAVALDTIEGLTDGTAPGTVKYIVHRPGQSFVKGAS